MIQGNTGSRAMLLAMLEKDGFDQDVVEKIYKIEMKLIKHIEYKGVVPDYFELQDVVIEEKEKKVYWVSKSTEANCPFCSEKSTEPAKEYYHKDIQDIPVNGMAVYHVCRFNKYWCSNNGCKHKIFIERIDGFCDECARKTQRFKKYLVLEAVKTNCHAAEQSMNLEGAKVSNDTIGRYTKAISAKVIKENLEVDNVEVLSVDDINLKKGNKSSACTVFIDEKSHKVLIIVRGATKEAAAQVLKKFTNTKIVSRDRANAYASAASDANKIQVADRFHLIKNAQSAIKEALMSTIPARIFIREGDGWVSIDGQGDNEPTLNENYFHVPEETVTERIRLAKLAPRQEVKYRNTLKILELSQKGIRTADIANKLGIKMTDVNSYRRVAVETLKSVEEKIEKNVEIMNFSQQQRFEEIATRDIKTIGPKAHPSSESIVEPFRETVLTMLKEGYNHRTIYPALKEIGFMGCPNAIYQYIVKIRKENMENARPNEFEKPQTLNLESVTHATVYSNILNEASKDRPQKVSKCSSGAKDRALSESNSKIKTQSRDLTAPKDSPLSPEIKALMFGKGQTDETDNQAGKSSVENVKSAESTEAKKK